MRAFSATNQSVSFPVEARKFVFLIGAIDSRFLK
jgi:hypothetical protein